MSRKSVIKPFKIFDSADGTTNFQSNPTNISNIDNITMTVYWTGDVVGVLRVYTTSQDIKADPNVHWVELDFGIPIAVSGSSYHTIQINGAPGEWMMVEYTYVSGTLGVVDVTMTAKVVGA